MVKFLTFALACTVLASAGSRGQASPANRTHPSLSIDTVIQVGGPSPGRAFQSLLFIAQQNRIPMGIVVGDSPLEPLCENSFSMEPGNRTISDLIVALRSSAPGYDGEIKNGVLEIRPQVPPQNLFAFLNMTISRFQSPPGPHVHAGSSLWMGIRGVIAPGEGTDIETLAPLDAETIPGLTIADRSVDFILDAIARAGSGGVWVLHAGNLKVLSNMTPMPYEIHGYAGEGNLETTIRCSTK